jgi:multicomponent Na+:H+ antiporter subunit E
MNGFWFSPLSFPLRTLSFTAWFLWQFVITSLRVVALIATPGRQAQPAIVGMDVRSLSETEVTLLLALITITPDTLVIAVDRAAGKMFVHGMFGGSDPEAFRQSLGDTHDRLLAGVRLRPPSSKKLEAPQ